MSDTFPVRILLSPNDGFQKNEENIRATKRLICHSPQVCGAALGDRTHPQNIPSPDQLD
jgi:hypothetical protein